MKKTSSESEASLTKRIKAHLDKISGLWYLKVSDRYTSGVPDIIGVYMGSMFAIEIKKTGVKKPRKIQDYFLQRIHSAGGHTACVDSYEKYLQFIEAIKYEV